MAEEEDNRIVGRWQSDADGILIFTGFFSIAVATLVAVSIQDLKQSSQDTAAFYLENIYQLLADPNISRSSIPPTDKPPPFSPPRHAVWVNLLWFLSLAISLTCGLLANSLRQWARRYVRVTRPPRCSPHKRARIRAFFFDGVDKLHVSWAVEALPTLLHLSLFLFSAGLLIFLFNVNHSVFSAVVGWVGLSAAIYACVTLLPTFRQDSPYYAPLSSTAWLLNVSARYAIFKVLSIISFLFSGVETHRHFADLSYQYRNWILGGVEKAAEETARKRSSELDPRILQTTFGALEEDHARERFFEAIPGFLNSNVVKDPRADLPHLFWFKFYQALDDFLDRTLSSSSFSEPFIVGRRLVICLNAAREACSPAAVSRILDDVFDERWRPLLQSVEIGHWLRRWSDRHPEPIALYAKSIVSCIIASVRRRDDRWLALAMDQLGVSEGVFRNYLADGDSVVLANLIHIIRHSFCSDYPLSHMLPLLCRFDVQRTLPDLQHEFCYLWNEIVQEARVRKGYDAVHVLRHIRHIYLAIHRGTDAAPAAFVTLTDRHSDSLRQPSFYPLCKITGHRSGLHEVAAAEGTTHVLDITRPSTPKSKSGPSNTIQLPHAVEQSVLWRCIRGPTATL